MKTITLTKSEIETLYDYLWCNPCSAKCVCDYTKIKCEDTREDGKPRCRLQRDTDSILDKLGK